MEMTNEKLPAIIPARAGSKGIINKNIIDFCGKPLIAWSIEQALASNSISQVYVTTNGENIAKVAKEYGASIIWRPEELALDTSDSESAIIHAIDQIEEEFDSVVFLQATSPIRRIDDIEKAIMAFQKGGYDSLFSMSILEDYCIWKKRDNKLSSFSYDYKMRGRRQEREKLYLENGSIYIFKKDLLLREHNRLGGSIGMFEMPFECSYEIDSSKDIPICEFFMSQVAIVK